VLSNYSLTFEEPVVFLFYYFGKIVAGEDIGLVFIMSSGGDT